MQHLCRTALAGLLLVVFCANLSAQNPVFTETENGFIFQNHTKNTGPKPQPGEQVTLNMGIWLGDTLMATNTLPAADVPQKEWITEPSPILDALFLMAAGDSVTVLQPIDSTLRPALPPSRQKEQYIRYELRLVRIISAAEREAATAKLKGYLTEVEQKTQALVKEYAAGSLTSKLTTTASGLQMIVHEQGTGAKVQSGEGVRTHYYGCLTDGKPFDNSFERGEPLEFQQGVGQMIPGFDEGTGLLNHGGKATLFVPYQLGYGEEGTPDGTIPAKSTLVFYIEVQ